MLKRITNLVRGFLGLFIGGIERKSPEALLDVEKENLRKEIANYNRGLAAHAGMCEELITRVTTLTAEEKDIRAKASAPLRAGNRNLNIGPARSAQADSVCSAPSASQ